MNEIGPADTSIRNLPNSRAAFWTTKQIVLDSFLIVFAIIAAYLQYYFYPLVMSRPAVFGNGFGETNITLKLSFLTFQYVATRCTNSSCVRLAGIPAFDFFQAILLMFIVVNLVHLYNVRKLRH